MLSIGAFISFVENPHWTMKLLILIHKAEDIQSSGLIKPDVIVNVEGEINDKVISFVAKSKKAPNPSFQEVFEIIIKVNHLKKLRIRTLI